MNNIFRGLIAGYGAKKLGGGCFGTIIVFIIIWVALGQCSWTSDARPAPETYPADRHVMMPAFPPKNEPVRLVSILPTHTTSCERFNITLWLGADAECPAPQTQALPLLAEDPAGNKNSSTHSEEHS